MCWLRAKAAEASSTAWSTRTSSASLMAGSPAVSVKPPRPVVGGARWLGREAIWCPRARGVKSEVLLRSVALSASSGASESEAASARVSRLVMVRGRWRSGRAVGRSARRRARIVVIRWRRRRVLIVLLLTVVAIAVARSVVAGVLVAVAVIVTTAAAAATWAVTVAHCDAPKRVCGIGGLRWSDAVLGCLVWE
jgi:hypothetical protein